MPARTSSARTSPARTSAVIRRSATALAEEARIRDYFLGWQARVRQRAMRERGGRPTAGMTPKVYLPTGAVLSQAMTVVMVHRDPEEAIAFLRFNVAKSNDPRVIYEKGLTYLQSGYFQQIDLFSDELTALFTDKSFNSTAVMQADHVVLEFEDYGQTFRLIATARRLAKDDPAYQATIWHNRTFNPAIPNTSVVLAFTVDWASAQAHPGPPM